MTTHDAEAPPVEPRDVIVQRLRSGPAVWLMGMSILVQSLWNPVLLVLALSFVNDGPLDLAAPIGYGTLLVVVVLVAVVVAALYALVKPDDIKLDATGWATGRGGKWRRLPLPPATAIDPQWSPVHGWRVRVRFPGVKRLYLHTPWVPPWRRRGEAFDTELRTIRDTAERHGARLSPLRRRLAWWPIVGTLLVVVGLAGVGYGGVRDGVVWPWSSTIDQTLDACQALDTAELASHWPETERERHDTGPNRDDRYASVRECAWTGRDDATLSRVDLTLTRNKSTIAKSGIAGAATSVRRDFEVWTDYPGYGTAKAVDGLGDEAYLLHRPGGQEVELSFHVANVGVELTVRASADGPPAEQLALALGRGIATQLAAIRA